MWLLCLCVIMSFRLLSEFAYYGFDPDGFLGFQSPDLHSVDRDK